MARAAAEGIVIYKDLPTTADAFADVAEYREKAPFDAVTNFTLTSGQKFSLLKSQIVLLVSYDAFDTTPDILQVADSARINTLMSQLVAIEQKYPHSEKFLAGRLRLLKSEVERFGGGQLKFEGRWFATRKELDALLVARRAEAARQEALEKQRVEALRVAEEKRRAQEAEDLAVAEQARANKRKWLKRPTRKRAKLSAKPKKRKKMAEEKQMTAARLETQRQEEERRKRELQIEEERREGELLRYVAERFKRVDRFRRDLTEPVLPR